MVVKWAVELSIYFIDFRSRWTIKSQVLADFIAEWTDMQAPISANRPEHWIMYFDGAGTVAFFISPSKGNLRYVLRIHFLAFNNAVTPQKFHFGM
jgi:hypothetical protein